MRSFCEAVGEPQAADLYLGQDMRMPHGWPLLFFGVFRGRPASPLCVCGYLDETEKAACTADSNHLAAENEKPGHTASEEGWHISRYNLMAVVPGSKNVAIANLFKGNCAEYTPIEMYLLSVLEELDENHPIIERFARRGIIASFDERAALETMGRAACAMTHRIGLTICPPSAQALP